MKKIKNLFNDCSSAGEVVIVILVVIAILALAFGLLCLEAWIGMLLWNWFVAGMLGFAHLELTSIWQMWGIILLCNILFKSHTNTNNNNND